LGRSGIIIADITAVTDDNPAHGLI